MRGAWLTVLTLLLASAARADELKTLAGKTVSGKLAGISDTELTVKTEAGTVATPLNQVLALELRPLRELPAGASYTLVQLIDETALRCQKVSFQAADLELILLSGAVIKTPLATVGGVLRDAQDVGLLAQWEKLGKQRTRRDRILVLRDGELNPLEGTLGDVDVDKQTIQFRREGAAPVALPFARLQGMSFYRTEAGAEQALCRVIDQDGSSLVAARLSLGTKGLTVITTSNTKVELAADTLARLDFNFGKLTYLSDLDARVIPSPWLGGINSVRRDLNLDGNPIALADRTYGKGLSMYAGTELEYQLGGKYKELKAVLGADPRIAEEGQGEVVVTIYCDGEKRLTEVVPTRAPRSLALNVKDVNVVRIVTAGRDFTNLAGHATLADARVSQ